MRLARLSFAILFAAVACGEVSSPSTDAPPPIDAGIDADTMATVIVTKSGTGAGTVASTPAGIDCGATCSGQFTIGAIITLTATPEVGSSVVSWGGACAGTTGTTCTVTVTADAAVSIEFGPAQHTVTLNVAGNGAGEVVSAPAGLSCSPGGGACVATFAYGTSLTLTAAPSPGSLFGGWSGGICTGLGPCTFTVIGDAVINSSFQLDNFTLIVSKAGNGTGTVTSAPAGINCGATCAMSYAFNSTVVLTAMPSPDSVFNGWTGACTGTGTCTVTMTQSRMVTASFTLRQFTLTAATAGTGTGTVTSNPAGINCGVDCTEPYDSGTTVSLTATPAANSTFTGWSGACSGVGACTVTMTAAASVTATFTLQQFTLTVTKAGAGSGTVTSSPAGINCGATCSASYGSGTVVTLTAAATGTSTFAGWSGACTGTGTCVVTMSAARAVTATFNGSVVTITVSKSGLAAAGAVVTSSPAGITCGATCSGSFAPGTVVTLTTTVGGSVFNGWSGAGCSGTGSCVFTVSAATTISATYRGARVALNASAMSCLRAATNAYPRVTTLVQARGHTVTVVTGAEIDTAAEINAFDVVVIPGPGNSGCVMPDYTSYDAVVDQYVRTAGHGVVASGWFLFSDFMSPQLVGVLPSTLVANYLSGNQSVAVVSGHPITTGVANFTTNQWLPWGGGPQPGATGLLTVGGTTVAEAWTLGAGRSVFAGPMFVEDYGAYDNESLLDGTQAGSIEFFMRSIEWAAKAR
ncbi:MAG: hypothetical protein IPL61_05215 [Myxococcales bacterium]|nr:hypothetical protein [Myxococcales bacterium]